MKMLTLDNKQEKYVKKHNAAIRSYSEMSLLQKKIANVLLYNAYHNLKTEKIHTISISNLLNLLSLKTNDYQKLKQAIKQLMLTIVEWDISKKENIIESRMENKKLFDSKESWKACTLLSSVQVNGTIIKYEYSELLKDFFYQPSLYSKISLSIQSKFRSGYSISLYENCLSYVNCGTTGWLDIGLFRKMVGVKPALYKIFRDLNKRVLQPSVKEVNDISNIEITYEIRKIGKVVSSIKFYIKHKKVAIEPNLSFYDKNVVKQLETYGISNFQCKLWLEKYGESYINEKLNIVKNNLTKVKKPSAFLTKAIRENWSDNNIKQPITQINQEEVIEKIHFSKAENIAWFNSLSDKEKITFFNDAVFKFPMLQIYMENKKMDVLNKDFINDHLFQIFAQILNR